MNQEETLGWHLNCRSRSVTMVEGTPKHAIHPLRKTCGTVSTVKSERGMVPGQRVKRSTHVRR